MRIMIVDDDQMIVRGLVNIIEKLELANVRIMTSYNALDALEALKYEGADLLITDVEMPVMNGLALIKEIQKRGCCEKFIILSGFDSFDFVRQALRFHVADYLLKPIDKTEFQSLVSRFYGELHSEPLAEEVDSLPGLDIYGIEPEPGAVPERFAVILRFMRAHFTMNLSLDKLSEQFGVHPNYICSLFHSYMKTTFLHYLDCLRLRKCVALLLNERGASMTEVAESSGFMNERQFYNVFKKRMGVTPGAFRKQHEGIRIRQDAKEA